MSSKFIERSCLKVRIINCRKRLVNSMITNTKGSSTDKVNELKGVEEDIEKIRKKIQMKEGKTN